MSTEVAEVEEQAVALKVKEPAEPLLSKRRRRIVPL